MYLSLNPIESNLFQHNNTEQGFWASLVAQLVKESACNAGDPGLIPGLGRSLEKGKATHSSILAWRIPWTNPRVAKSRT